MYRIMIVDDEENILRALKRLLVAAPCYHEGVTYKLEVETYASPLAALEKIKETPYALVISDFRMPDLNGAEFLKQVYRLQPDSVRMILSGYPDLDGLVEAINEARIARFIAKPWNDYDLISIIGQALAYRDMLLENRRLADECRLKNAPKIPEALVRVGESKLRQEEPKPGHWGPDGSAVCDDTSNWYG
jgi:DNA-binding NtrC family response regulator